MGNQKLGNLKNINPSFLISEFLILQKLGLKNTQKKFRDLRDFLSFRLLTCTSPSNYCEKYFHICIFLF